MTFVRASVLVISLVVISALGVTLILNLNIPASTQNQLLFDIEEAFPNLQFFNPVGIYHSGDSTNRLFVVAQEGEIYVFENSEGVATAKVFLDIKDRVLFGGEQGLLGLAFHPDFADNGFFFVDYTAENPRRTVIARFAVSQVNPDQAEKDSGRVILEVPQPFSNHNGGQIAFGLDGYLYVALGDGGSGGDPQGNGQDRLSLLGSILRIDVNAPSEGKEYGIPVDNPFMGNSEGYREEIYAYGLRNPWRFTFDPLTGWLWVGDVGQNRREEIDIVEKGKNYGWNIMEGSLCYSPSEGCNRTGLELPLWEYGRDLGISITGGFVYRGSKFPDLIGTYVYGDFGSGRIWALEYDGVDDPVNLELLDTGLNIASFGIDEDNELYICAFDGKIYELTYLSTSLQVSSPLQVPSEPTPDQSVRVSVNVTAENGVGEVILSYSNNSEWENVTMSLVAENEYVADIPAMPDQTEVKYRIFAYDKIGNYAVKDNLGQFYRYLVVPEFSSVTIFVIVFVAGSLLTFTGKRRKESKV